MDGSAIKVDTECRAVPWPRGYEDKQALGEHKKILSHSSHQLRFSLCVFRSEERPKGFPPRICYPEKPLISFQAAQFHLSEHSVDTPINFPLV